MFTSFPTCFFSPLAAVAVFAVRVCFYRVRVLGGLLVGVRLCALRVCGRHFCAYLCLRWMCRASACVPITGLFCLILPSVAPRSSFSKAMTRLKIAMKLLIHRRPLCLCDSQQRGITHIRTKIKLINSLCCWWAIPFTPVHQFANSSPSILGRKLQIIVNISKSVFAL